MYSQQGAMAGEFQQDQYFTGSQVGEKMPIQIFPCAGHVYAEFCLCQHHWDSALSAKADL